MESKRITRHIDRLLLDPNNYRFIDRPDYKLVSEDQLADSRVQQRTMSFLQGKNYENIRDLISSYTTNGVLDIDQIQVRAVGDKYLVLEGNRRTATLKFLYEQFKQGHDVGMLTESNFKSVDVVEIMGESPVHHLITMGLQHISGKKRWSAVNEAQLVSDLMNIYGKSEAEVCDALGITKFMLRKSMRTLGLVEQYKRSDYGDQFKADMFSIFQSIVGSPAMKSWIGWDDEQHKARNTSRIERLFSWISETEEIEESEDGREDSKTSSPIITQYRQIKELAEFIDDPKAVERMEESRSVTEGFTYSDAIGVARLHNALSNIRSEVQVAFNFSEHLVPADYEEIERLKSKLDRLIPSSLAVISLKDKRPNAYFQQIANHFDNTVINTYRKLEGVRVKNLSRVNIFAGGNNTGKTSVLEAFYLLSQLNDINALLELEKVRGKFYGEMSATWVNRSFHSIFDASAEYNGVPVTLTIRKEEKEDDIERTGYLATITEEARVDRTELASSINLYINKEPEQRFLQAQVLCPAAYTSPYHHNSPLLLRAHNAAVQGKYFEEVVGFIRQHLDDTIENIELVNEDGQSRFQVSSSIQSQALDITKYGEGLQRIFEIALLMRYCNDGIICIDEVDSAIHKGLLRPFTRFIQDCASRFNVQVFLSTHSKECIDAFVENGFGNEELTAYALTADQQGKLTCKFIDGNRLELLVENINFDIR